MGQYDPKTPKKINPVSITFTLILLGLGYLGWWYGPHWIRVFQLSGIMRGIASEAYREHDNKVLMEKLLKEAKRTGLKLNEQNFKLVRERYPPEELAGLEATVRTVWEKRGKFMRVEFAYKTKAKWPLSEKITDLEFRRTVKQDLTTIEW